MTRNPYARALRVKPQQIVRDRRDEGLTLWYDRMIEEELERGILPEERDLLNKLD